MPATKRPAETLGSEFKYEPCKVVAEIGCNHMGSMDIAKELMKLAKECGSTYAKFQKRCPKELLTPEQYNKPHPVPANAYGATYGAHREFLEFSLEQHRELYEYGKVCGARPTLALALALSLALAPPALNPVQGPRRNHSLAATRGDPLLPPPAPDPHPALPRPHLGRRTTLPPAPPDRARTASSCRRSGSAGRRRCGT